MRAGRRDDCYDEYQEVAIMADELSELLKSLKAAKEILNAEDASKKPAKEVPVPSRGAEPERKVSLGDVAKATHDYEREPFEKK
jgi:hypothetical protein